MHKNATKCNKTQSKWCINKHGASKIIDTFETYQSHLQRRLVPDLENLGSAACQILPLGRQSIAIGLQKHGVAVGYSTIRVASCAIKSLRQCSTSSCHALLSPNLAWDPLLAADDVPAPERHDTLPAWWKRAKQASPKPLRKGLASIVLLTPWTIWKHHNRCTFDGAQPSTYTFITHIKDEAAIWARTGAPRLRVILPRTWDVH
jgi:hypothetical protein